MKKLLYAILLLTFWNSFSQNFKITYQKSSNGALLENQDLILVYTNSEQTLLSSESITNQKALVPYEQTRFDRKSNSYYQIAVLKENKIMATKDSTSLAKQTFEYLAQTKKILGYNCKKAKTIVNSNTIEFWYTEDLKVYGSPSVLGQNLGLILEMVRNGNFVIAATQVEKIKVFPIVKQPKSIVDALTYKDLLWKSRFTTLPIFRGQIINFSEESKSNDSILRFANGTMNTVIIANVCNVLLE